MTMKLPPLGKVESCEDEGFVVGSFGMLELTESQAAEVIRRCEMHDRLVAMLEKATNILEAEFSEQADPSPDDACYIAEQCRAILKENQ